MTPTDRPERRRSLLLALLVGALLGGVIGMHHLAVGGGHGDVRADAAAVTSMVAHGTDPVAAADDHRPGEGSHGDGTALLHLCLAVLAAVAIALPALLLWWHPTPPPPVPAVGGGRYVVSRPRGPPRGAPARLALLCVLRT